LGLVPQLPMGDSAGIRAEPPTDSPTGRGEEIAPNTTSDASLGEGRSWWRKLLGMRE
jgi:hypothetical protein